VQVVLSTVSVYGVVKKGKNAKAVSDNLKFGKGK
jgi:hypothetical protein